MRTGLRVMSVSSQALQEIKADILHLGDVLEHLTDLNRQMPEILKFLKPGGLLLAQGPLEGNPTLFTIALRLHRRLRRRPASRMPPYHVILATAKGQSLLFRRFGLQLIEFSMREVSWPAPRTLRRGEILNLRLSALFFLSCVSRFLIWTLPFEWGNRYFYAGRWNG